MFPEAYSQSYYGNSAFAYAWLIISIQENMKTLHDLNLLLLA